MICNNDRKLTIRAFDHYYGFLRLLDEVSVLVVPELEEKWSAPPCISARTGRAGFSRQPDGGRLLLFPAARDTVRQKGEREDIRRWLNSLMTRVNLLYHCEPVSAPLVAWLMGCCCAGHHSKLIPPCEKPADLTELTLTYYQDHHEYHAIGKLLQQLLAEQGVKLTINITDYDTWF